MPNPADVMITVPLNQRQQYGVSGFLKVKPSALGILEILIGGLVLGFTFWSFFVKFLWLPVIYILIGILTVSAGCTSNSCLVKSSQFFNYLNTVVAAVALFFHFTFTWGVICFLLVACDILMILFSIIVAATSCNCCCRPKVRHPMMNYMNTDLPANHVMVIGQPGSSASSVLYILPSAPASVQPVLLPNCSPVPNPTLPKYSPVPSTPPPSYEQVIAASALNNSPMPSAPPLTNEII